MTDTNPLQDFTNLVLRNLEKNGFPEKAVSFPVEKMYENASQRGFSFNKVRDALKEQQIQSEISGDRVIFTKVHAADQDLEGFDMSKMAEIAQQMFAKMNPKQQAKVSEMMQSMSPEDMARMQEKWNATPLDEKMKAMKNL